MTDQELIKRLLGWPRDIQEGSTDIWAMAQDLKEAAYRIEELVEERERLALAICGGEDAVGYANAQSVEALEKVARDNAAITIWQINKTMQKEAKLAKAVEALREIYEVGNATGCNPQWMTNTAAKALAELEGK